LLQGRVKYVGDEVLDGVLIKPCIDHQWSYSLHDL